MRIFFIIAISFIALSTSLCRGQTYHLTDLAQTIGKNSYAQGINDKGEIVGYWNSTNGEHAFLYQGLAQTLRGLGGPGAASASADALNISEAAGAGANVYVTQDGQVLRAFEGGVTLPNSGGTSINILGFK
jgi:probable HAF family extracellular repeat protein